MQLLLADYAAPAAAAADQAMTAARVCAEPGCPTIVTSTAYRGRCDTHRRQWDQQRGTTTQRGYGANHQQERVAWQRRIDSGELIFCWRCGEQIQQGAGWHLGHDDVDRSITRGPEHDRRCNLSAAGRASHT